MRLVTFDAFLRSTSALCLLGTLGTECGCRAKPSLETQPSMVTLGSSSVATPAPPPPREPLALTDTERATGHHECNMPDHGNGIYAPVRSLSSGLQVMVPAQGGHTDDFGYDVVFHLHGFDPLRKTIVESARGVVFAGLDVGNGSSPYVQRFTPPGMLELSLAEITTTLQKHSGDERAHIRHLALSAWSAGYGGVNAILRQGDTKVDAVVLLDGFHTDFKPNAPHDDDPESVDGARLSPLFAFAERATRGEKIFFVTHSSIGTDYVSTTRTSNLLLKRLGLVETAVDPGTDPMGMYGFVDQRGFRLRAYKGTDERAHCDQTRHMAEAVRSVIEPAWKTPAAAAAEEAKTAGTR